MKLIIRDRFIGLISGHLLMLFSVMFGDLSPELLSGRHQDVPLFPQYLHISHCTADVDQEGRHRGER